MVIDHLQSSTNFSKIAVAYVYFDYKNNETQNVLVILYNLLRQLLEQLDTVPQELQRNFESFSSRRKENKMTLDECYSFIQNISQKFGKVFLVFDAVDECPVHDTNSNELRPKIISMIQKVSSSARTFVTSRPHVNLAQDLNDCISIDVRASHSDMYAYLEARIDDHTLLRKQVNQDPALKKHLIGTIGSKANGM